MRPLYIFRHIECEGPGYLAQVLRRRGMPQRLYAIDQGEAPPADTGGCAGLVFMGGPMSVNDPLPWIDRELALIREASARGLPVLGHCLGGQLIAKALGADIGPNPVKEIGWHPVSQRPEAGDSPWLAGVPTRFTAYHWHGETFTIPPGATPLLASAHCANQAFASGRTLAFQCHMEMTAELVREWAAQYATELAQPSASVQTAAQMTADLDARIEALQRIADTLYGHWLRGIAELSD